MSLRHALGYPYDVSVLLFLELDVGVEDAKVELVHESILHKLNLNTTEQINSIKIRSQSFQQ